ncbi:MAG TPA: glycosyltransferase family A protein [Ignavibacteria bacterium]|nr:glycosyltransferase family A protein [Ignavibacteria bacterium]HMR38840.1 glycosyltransferase family A protein [Ignavibacteria bacterium]
MKFSVIITTFNRAGTIPMCMDSLINQNFPKSDYEIIIINNNSSDNTEEVIEKYIKDYPDTEIKYYFIPKPGQVYARQIGILAAENEILSFTDDDGILSPDWLKEIRNVFELNKEAVGVAGKILIKWDEEPPLWIREYENFLGKLNYGDEIKYSAGLYMNAGNLSIKKNILIEVGGFNPEMIGEWLMGDGETGLWLRLKNKNYIIGWAPKAIMEHYQIAKKNATVEDIKRRFMNNGICIPYNIFAIEKKGYRVLIWNMFLALKQAMKWKLNKLKASLKFDEKNEKYSIFRTAFYTAQIKYTMKIISDKKFRTALTKGDWIIKNSDTIKNKVAA